MINRVKLKDAIFKIILNPQNESKLKVDLKFIPNEGIDLKLYDLKFKFQETTGDQPAIIEGDIQMLWLFVNMKMSKVIFNFSNLGLEDLEIELRIHDFDVSINEKSISCSTNGQKINDFKLKQSIYMKLHQALAFTIPNLEDTLNKF